MISVSCQVMLASDNNRKISIQIRKENDGKLSWKVVESSKGSLNLPADEGEWYNSDWSNILTLFYKYENKKKASKETGLMLVAYNVNSDFLTDITNGKSIEANDADLYNGNVTEQKVKCKLSA